MISHQERMELVMGVIKLFVPEVVHHQPIVQVVIREQAEKIVMTWESELLERRRK